jgi:hypothetical protein
MNPSTGSGAVFTAIGLVIGLAALLALVTSTTTLRGGQALQHLANAYQVEQLIR